MPSHTKHYRKHKEPMKFNGKTDWRDYHSHFMAVAEWNGWDEAESGLQLAISLVDEAREILSSMPHFERNNYHAIVKALKQRYDPDGQENSYSMELMNRIRKAGEDTTAYGYALLRLAHKAYPNMPLPEQVLINIYINGLGEKDLKRHVYLSKPETLEKAIKIASVFEGFEEKPKTNMPKKPKASEVNAVKGENTKLEPGITPDMLKGFEKCMTEISERLSNLEKRPQQPQRRPMDKSKIQCFRCKNYGHYSRECAQNVDQKTRSDRQGQGSAPPHSAQGPQVNKPHLN